MDKQTGQKSNQITRRDFAKVSAAAGFAVLTSKNAAAAKIEPDSETLKVGLLGCGGRGSDAARQMLQGNDNVALVALADLFEDKVASRRRMYEQSKDDRVSSKFLVDDDHCFVGFDAYKKLFETDIDIVVEGTLPYSRPAHIDAAVEAGKHIFTEKPAAVDPPGIRKVIAAAKKAKEKGLCIAAGTQRRHQREYIETIEKIHDGAIGEVVAGRAYWAGNLPFARDRKPEYSDLEYRIRNWYGLAWVAGDSIVEQHVHNLDVLNWVLQSHPVSVFASGGRTWKPKEEKFGDIYDHFSCDYEYPNGVHVLSIARHWNECASGVFEEAVGTKGRSNCRDMGERGINPYVQEHIDLVKAIRGEAPYLNEGVQVAESTMTAIMGRMSAYTGERVKWEDAMASDLSLVPEVLDFSREYPVGPVPSPGAGNFA